MDNVLYFPYISIPRSTWLMQTLLYWDKIGTIVPSDYIYRPSRLSKHMRVLVQEQLVEQIFPAIYIEDIRKMHESFLNHVDNKIEGKLRPIYQRNSRAFLFEKEPFNEFNSVKIHMEKLDSLAEDLIYKGVAKRADGPWYWVQKEIGYDFMAFLVSIIGYTSRYSPITNDEIYLSNYFDSPGFRPSTVKSEIIRHRMLKNILPIPANEIEIDSLIEFKRRHQRQLANFRNLIERYISDVNNYPEEEHEDKINEFMKAIEEQKDEIRRKMAENKWSVAVGNFVSIGSPLGGVGFRLLTGNKIGAIMKVPKLLSAIYNAISYNNLDEFRDHPIAYSLYIDQEKNKLFRKKR